MIERFDTFDPEDLTATGQKKTVYEVSIGDGVEAECDTKSEAFEVSEQLWSEGYGEAVIMKISYERID